MMIERQQMFFGVAYREGRAKGPKCESPGHRPGKNERDTKLGFIDKLCARVRSESDFAVCLFSWCFW